MYKRQVSSCAKSGVLAFTGDGTNAAVMDGALAAISAAGGMGVPTVKPWDRDTVFAKLEQVRKADPVAIAMDIDAAGLPFLQNLTPPAGSKTVPEPVSYTHLGKEGRHGDLLRLPRR